MKAQFPKPVTNGMIELKISKPSNCVPNGKASAARAKRGLIQAYQ